MTSLRRRMTEDMQVRSLSPQTQATYVQQVSLFARHFNRSPELLGLRRFVPTSPASFGETHPALATHEQFPPRLRPPDRECWCSSSGPGPTLHLGWALGSSTEHSTPKKEIPIDPILSFARG
jgi:hypothetical protein